MNIETKLARINNLQSEKANLQKIISGHNGAYSFSLELNKKLQEIQEKYVDPLLEEHSEQLKGFIGKYCTKVNTTLELIIYNFEGRDRLGVDQMKKQVIENTLRISKIDEELACILSGNYYKKTVNFVYNWGNLCEEVFLTSENEETVYNIITKVMEKTFGSKAKMFSLLFGLGSTGCTEYTNWTMNEIVRVYSTSRLNTIKANAKNILESGIGDLYEISDLVDLLK